MSVPIVENVAQTGPNNEATTIVVSKPAGTVEGDLLVAFITGCNGSAQLHTIGVGSTGFTQQDFQREVPDGGSVVAYLLATKVAGPSEPSSYTFTNTHSTPMSGGILRVSGAHASLFWNVLTKTYINDASNSTQNCPTATTTANDCLILRLATSHGFTGVVVPAGTTEILRRESSVASGFSCLWGAYSSLATAGATGTAAYTGWNTLSNRDGWTITVGIAPVVQANLVGSHHVFSRRRRGIVKRSVL